MEDYNVSSVVVMCKAKDVESLWERLPKILGVECHFKDESGKIVITIEASCIEEEIKTLKQVEAQEGVILAQMMYSYHQKELENLEEKMQQSSEVPNILEEQIDAKNIFYGGNIEEHFKKMK
ncbi:chaperone NapD [Helicobacter burdigaliensis]|uniref:chaperone NapD n=1 Tax=Helicobacter burdigaliensis TaxID=2315334 RepID=UPI000EF6AF3C|nr:chaperone NapD [Helicobacter burdigaliensis]